MIDKDHLVYTDGIFILRKRITVTNFLQDGYFTF